MLSSATGFGVFGRQRLRSLCVGQRADDREDESLVGRVRIAA